LLHTLPLAARRRFPGAVLGITVASGLAVAALGLPPVVLGLAILVAVYSVAAYGDRWTSLAGLAAAELGSAAIQLTPGRVQTPTVISNGLVIGAAWLLGHFVGIRRAYTARLERTAALERARAESARRAVIEERLRLARELHDVVAHSISVIAVQSGVGAHVANTQPEEAAKALAAIEATSRAALTELRRLLGVLREEGEPQGSLAPVPGLADLDALVAEVAKVGVGVRVRVEGTPSQLPVGVDLSAYRIVQEALTNVVKHAGTARAQVTIGYRDHEVMVEVSDDGQGVIPPTDNGQARVGHGLIGMRERVAAFGGDLEVGPRPGGGFRVAARLPLTADQP
jgi:signal transduction histidine kinase